jgi:hypothetical protein
MVSKLDLHQPLLFRIKQGEAHAKRGRSDNGFERKPSSAFYLGIWASVTKAIVVCDRRLEAEGTEDLRND